MNYGNQDESGWDTLASELGLAPAPKPAPPPAPPPEKTAPESDADANVVHEEVVKVIPARVAEIQLKVTRVAEEVEPETAFGEGIVEDAADVLDDEAPEDPDAAADGDKSDDEGKGRRRRRRRRRKKGGGPETVAEESVIADESASDVDAADDDAEDEPLGFPADDEEEVEVEGEQVPAEFAEDDAESMDDEDEVEEIVPAVALAEEEEESTEPLPEWKVTAWTELVATLYRPQDR